MPQVCFIWKNMKWWKLSKPYIYVAHASDTAEMIESVQNNAEKLAPTVWFRDHSHASFWAELADRQVDSLKTKAPIRQALNLNIHWLALFKCEADKLIARRSLKQTDSSWPAGSVERHRQAAIQSGFQVCTMFSCLSSGSPCLLLTACVKNSITAPGLQLGRVTVIKRHHTASWEDYISPFSFLFLIHLSSFTFYKGVMKHFYQFYTFTQTIYSILALEVLFFM